MTNPWRMAIALFACLCWLLAGCTNPPDDNGGSSSSSSGSSSGTNSSSSGGDASSSGSSSSGADASSGGSSSSGADAASSSSSGADTSSSSTSGGTGYAALHPKLVVATKCSDGYCHNIAAGGLELKYKDVDGAYKALMSGEAKGLFKDDCKAKKYVVPGKPEQSLLWLKLDKNATHGCGNKMPPDPKPGGVSSELSAAVKKWILDGAKP